MGKAHEDQELNLLNRVVTRLLRSGHTLQAARPPAGAAANPVADAARRLDDTIRDIRDHILFAYLDEPAASPWASGDGV